MTELWTWSSEEPKSVQIPEWNSQHGNMGGQLQPATASSGSVAGDAAGDAAPSIQHSLNDF